jgi:hypothetical protein
VTKNQDAVLLFARTPQIARSAADEPFAALPWEDLDAIFHACLGDIVNRATGVPDVDVLVYRDERYLPAAKFSRPPEMVRVLDMPAGDFAPAVGQAVEHAFHEYYHRVVVVLENNPLLTAAAISRALDMLGTEDDAVVVLPAHTGGACLLALKANHPSLFPKALSPGGGPEGILGKLCQLDAQLYPTEPLFLVDSPAMIDELRRRISALDPAGPDFPALTSGVFRQLEKKYRLKKVGA